jgi:hypothetical protein
VLQYERDLRGRISRAEELRQVQEDLADGVGAAGSAEEEFDGSDDVIVGESKTQDEVLRERQSHAERAGQVIEVS